MDAIRNAAIPATLAAALLTVTSCKTPEVQKPLPVVPEIHEPITGLTESQVNFWNAEKFAAIDGDVAIKIDLSDQIALFYKSGELVGRTRVATGIRGRATPTGNYHILEKKVKKSSNLWGKIYDAEGNLTIRDADTRKDKVPEGGRYVGAPMPYWMRFTNTGIGMHAGPIPRPGRPASHGCVRTNRKMVPLFHNHAPLGTPVKIVE